MLHRLLLGLKLLAGIALVAAAPLVAQVEPPHKKAAPPVSNRAALVAFVTTTLKAWESGDAATFVGAFADNAVFAYPGDTVGKGALADLFADLQRRKRDIRIYVGPFIVLGNEFVVRYQFACTDRVTGKRQAVGTGVRGTVRDGKIVRFKEYWDAHIPEEQMRGELPLDEGNPDYPCPATQLMLPKRIN